VSGLIAAIDTSTEVSVLALGRWAEPGGIDTVAACEVDAPRAAMSRALPCLRELLDAVGASPRDIAEVVAGRGPGSFTGVRIGVATAKGLAHGLGVPLYGASTLDAIAWRIAAEDAVVPDGGLLGVVGDAMRGEVYPVLFRIAGGVATRLAEDAVRKPTDAAATWASELAEPLVLAGNGLAKHAAAFADAFGARAKLAPEGLWAPSGSGLLAAYAAARSAGSAGSGDPATLLPVYTRLSDAEENERTRTGTDAGPLPASGVGGDPGAVR
jgi:N6-L-threonylcarbamoyladenine synthase